MSLTEQPLMNGVRRVGKGGLPADAEGAMDTGNAASFCGVLVVSPARSPGEARRSQPLQGLARDEPVMPCVQVQQGGLGDVAARKASTPIL